MAKGNKHQDVAQDSNRVMVAIPAGLVLKFGEGASAREIDATSAGVATLAYLLQNGFNQSLVDSKSGAAQATVDEFIEAKILPEGTTAKSLKGSAALPEGFKDRLATIADEMVSKRYDAIVAGTVSAKSSGPRVRGIDKLIRDVATERLQALFSKRGQAWPNGKGAAAEINVNIDKWLAREAKGDGEPGRLASVVGTCADEAKRRAEVQAAVQSAPAAMTSGGDLMD